MAYVPFHQLKFPAATPPNALGKPTPIPKNTLGNIMPRWFSKVSPHNIPVVKLIIRNQMKS